MEQIIFQDEVEKESSTSTFSSPSFNDNTPTSSPIIQGDYHEAFCPIHDPRSQKDKKEIKLNQLIQSSKVFVPGIRILAKLSGPYFEGFILNRNEETRSCRIEFRDR